MSGRNECGVERLRRLARVSDRVMNRLMAACSHPVVRPGRPCRYALEVQLLVLLVKLRLDLPYRALEASGIDAVTTSRRVRRMLERLNEAPLAKGKQVEGFYLVDTTTVRVRAWQEQFYSGYKHHRGVKAQVPADEGRMIHYLSGAWPARGHDKVIWDRTVGQVQPFLNHPVLADKALPGHIWKAMGWFDRSGTMKGNTGANWNRRRRLIRNCPGGGCGSHMS